MNKRIEQKFDSDDVYWKNIGGFGWDTKPHREDLKSFFDSQIKQAAEEIRGKKYSKIREQEATPFAERYISFNEGLEAAAQHLESLI